MNIAVASRPPKTAPKAGPKPKPDPDPDPDDDVTGAAQTAQPVQATPQPTNAAGPIPERKVEQLGPNRLTEAEFVRAVFVATPHANTQPEDLEKPEYWAHVANKLKPWNRIEVRANDGSWYAECLVLAASRTEATVKVLGAWHLESDALPNDRTDSALAAYRVEFRGPHEQWGVIRKVDSELVHTGESTEAGAYGWLKERLKAGI